MECVVYIGASRDCALLNSAFPSIPAGKPTAGRSANASPGQAGIDGAIRRVPTHEASAVTQISVRVDDAVAELIFGRAHVQEVIEGTPVLARDGAFIFME